MVSHVGVTAEPQDMCMITPSEVAVAVDVGYEVQFITVNQSQLVLARKFQLPHTCVMVLPTTRETCLLPLVLHCTSTH